MNFKNVSNSREREYKRKREKAGGGGGIRDKKKTLNYRLIGQIS